MCFVNENFRNMVVFSEKLKIMNKFLFFVNFGVLFGFCEWGKKKKNSIFCVSLIRIICML